MRCPMCKARVRDQDDLQIHYMESCDAIGDQQDEDLGDEATSKEPIEEMVEVSFKWMNTKGTVERSICLISSLAGQIKLKPMLKDDAYKSGKIVVPCGLHCCQLVVGEECYPVIDLDIDSSCDVVYIVLQEDLDTEERTVQSMPSVPNAGFMSSESTPPCYPTHPRPFMDKGRPLLQDEIDADYARHILREIEREEQETATADEAISMQSHGSSCAARQGMRSDRPGSASAVEHHDEELTYMARNGMHAAQVHVGRGNGERSEAGRVEAARAEAGIVEVDKDEREKEHQRHSYHRQNGNGEALQRGTGTRKSRKRMLQKVADSAPYRPSGSESETILDPPQGFKSKITSEEKSSTTGQRRGSEEKTRANGHGGDSEDGRRDSKSSVDSLRNPTALEERTVDRRQPSGSEHEKAREVPEEKPKYSWGYDEKQRDLKWRDATAKSDVDDIDGRESERSRRDDKRTGSDTERIVKVRALDYQKAKSVPYGGPTEGEQISELIAKCRSYEHTLEKINEESNHLKEQITDLQEKSRKDTEELLSKEDKIDELQARCNSYETEMERFMAENNDLMNQLSKIQEENAEKDRNDLDRLKERLEDVLRENKDLKEENESLQTAHNLQQEDMDRINKGMQDEVEALKDKLNNVKVGNRSFQYSELHKVNALKEEVTELTAENRKLRSKLSNIQRELSITQTETSDNDKDHVTSPREYEAHDQIEAYDHEPYRASTDTYSRSRDRISAHDHDQVLDKAYSDIHVSSSREPLFQTATAVRDSETYDNRRQTTSGRSHRSYDTSAISSKYDTNHNYLLSSDLSTTRFRTLQTRKSDGAGPLRTTTTNPIRASHFDYLAGYEQEATSRHGVENSDHVDSTGAERVVRRERKPRRERPHSFHGRSSDASHNDPYSANESDSREISRRLSPLQHEDPGSYNYRLTNRTDDHRSDYLNSHDYTSTAADLSPRSLKPFAPTSIDEIKTGMRVLVTRSSGRIGKGTVKWKGKLDGHADHFIGIELETPNGKHDGVFERYRYFRCKKDHGIFAKFSKVVMVWGSI